MQLKHGGETRTKLHVGRVEGHHCIQQPSLTSGLVPENNHLPPLGRWKNSPPSFIPAPLHFLPFLPAFLLPFLCSTADFRSSALGLSESLSRLLERKLRLVPASLPWFTFSMSFANFSTCRCPSSCPARGSAGAEAGDE